jgi:hypothetical protein
MIRSRLLVERVASRQDRFVLPGMARCAGVT